MNDHIINNRCGNARDLPNSYYDNKSSGSKKYLILFARLENVQNLLMFTCLNWSDCQN